MKAIFNLCMLFSLTLVVVSCKQSQPKEITIKNKFKVEIPGYMRSTRSLNSDASMQFQSTIRELYLIVIEDEPEDVDNAILEMNEELLEEGIEEEYPFGFEGFCMLVGSNEDDSFITYDDWEYLEEEEISGLDAYTFTNSRKINGVNVYYKFAMIKGEDTYYQLIVWTLAGRKDRYKETIDNIVASFSEL